MRAQPVHQAGSMARRPEARMGTNTGEGGQGVVWRRGSTSRACAPGRVDGQKHGRPHGRRSSQREEKEVLRDSSLINSPAQCLLM